MPKKPPPAALSREATDLRKAASRFTDASRTRPPEEFAVANHDLLRAALQYASAARGPLPPTHVSTYHGVKIFLTESPYPGCKELVIAAYLGKGKRNPVHLEITVDERDQVALGAMFGWRAPS